MSDLSLKVDFFKVAEQACRHWLGAPNQALSKPGVELRWGSNGSFSLSLADATWFDHEANEGGGLLDLIKQRESLASDEACFTWMRSIGCDIPEPPAPQEKAPRARRKRGGAPRGEIAALYDYVDADGTLLFQAVRMAPKEFRQRRPMPGGGWAWSVTAGRYGRAAGSDAWRKLKESDRADDVRELEDAPAAPYRLPELLAAVAAGTRVFVVEGEKDVQTLADWGLTATCNAGGSGKWRAEFGAHFAGADVVVIADNDVAGRAHADTVCASLINTAARIRLLDLSEFVDGFREKGDVTDWRDAHGGTAASLAEIVAETPDWVPQAPRPPFPLLRFRELIAYTPDSEWLLKGWLGAGQLGVLYGKPKSGKSFIALDASLHVAHGWAWLNQVGARQGGVFYIAGEGGDGVKKRIAAWAGEYPRHSQNAAFDLAPHRFDLFSSPDGADQIAAYVNDAGRVTGRPYRLIVVDTLARAFAGGDENFAGDMGRFVENCDLLRAATGCAVLLVHHSAKGEAGGLRGSSALYGAVDTVWKASAALNEDGDEIPSVKRLILEDQKDGESGAFFEVALRQRVLGPDGDGGEATSCVIEPLSDSGGPLARPAYRPPERAPTGGLSAEEGLFLKALDQAIKTASADGGGNDFEAPSSVVSAAFEALGGVDKDARRALARALKDRGLISWRKHEGVTYMRRAAGA